MASFARLGGVVLECPDPAVLASFYRELLGWTLVCEDPDWYTLKDGDRDPGLSFQLAPEYQAPTWPDPAAPMQIHLDLRVDDLDGAERRVLALGATKFAFQPGETFRVYADPVGHPFCLCV